MTDIKNWAADAELNNEASPAGWPEGMPPSDVNNSARELMAAVRRSYVRQPWFAPGGAVTRVSDTQITIIDDAKVTNYSAYYSVGGRVRIEGDGGFVYGFIRQATYEAPTSTIEFTLDAEATLPAVITDVYVGLSPADIQGVVGPNLLGCIIGFTEEGSKIGAGLMLANGEKFNPNAYPDLADLYFTGNDSDGTPKYRYGRELVGGVYWPKRPDVRGYFPRFVDDRVAPASGGTDTRVDPMAPRTVGSTQADAFKSHRHFEFAAQTVYNDTSWATADRAAAVEGTSGSRRGEYVINRASSGREATLGMSSATGDSKETRVKNIAIVGVIVAYGGVTAGGLADVSVVIEDTATAKANSETAMTTASDATTVATAASAAANAAVSRVDGLESLIGDISGALDTINGEVV